MNAEDADRRMHWLRLARELGQEDDFRALMDDLRREGAEGARREFRLIKSPPDTHADHSPPGGRRE